MHASIFANGRQSGLASIAVYLANNVFELAFEDGKRRVVQRKRVSRLGFAKVLAEHPPVRLIMEAGPGRPPCRCVSVTARPLARWPKKLARRRWAMHHYGVAFDANHISEKPQAA